MPWARVLCLAPALQRIPDRYERQRQGAVPRMKGERVLPHLGVMTSWHGGGSADVEHVKFLPFELCRERTRPHEF